MALTAIQQRIGNVTVPPTPKTGASLTEVQQNTFTWTKQVQQTLIKISKVLGQLDTSQIPQGGTNVIGNVPTPPGVYFTPALARASVSATSPILYDEATGVFSILNAAADGTTKGAATFLAADFESTAGLISLDYANAQKASSTLPGFLTAADWITFNAKVSTSRLINTTSPLAGGGDLSADRTFTIADAAADGTTKGAATFLAPDFNSTAGLISLDYTNGQKATTSLPGFLSAADWTTFNAKVSATRLINTTAPITGGGDLSADRTFAMAKATTLVDGYLAATDWTIFNAKVSTSRLINTTAPITGGGDLSADRTFAMAKATTLVDGYLAATDWTIFNAKVSPARLINTTAPLSGGGDLSADRTFAIADAAADGTTKGAATFTAADFNSTAGLISLDYTNGQKATASVPGFLLAADWTTFNAKVSATRAINTTAPLSGGGDLSADRTFAIADAAADGTTKGAAAFAAADFNSASGVISLDYVNGQKASASVSGFLSSTDWSVFNTAASGNLAIITGNTTYFVRTDGSDSNAGTANTAGGAWLTIQKAINFVMQRLIIQKGVTVTIQIGDGTYTESPTCSVFLGGGTVMIQGNTTTPSNVVIATGTGGVNILSNGWLLNAFKITGTGNGIDTRSGALVTISNINLGTTGTSQLQAIYGGTIFISTALTFSASASFALFATRGGTIQSVSSPTLTISGTPAYTIFAFADINGVIYMPATTFSGSATGQRYSALLTGAIFTNAGGANYFPGNVAGSTATGGQYA